MRDKQVAAVWIALVLVAGIAGLLVHDEPRRPLGRDEAIRCGSHVADVLGYEVATPSAVDDGGSWTVSAVGDGVIVRIVVRSPDRRVTDVAVFRDGAVDILAREERLLALEAGCG